MTPAFPSLPFCVDYRLLCIVSLVAWGLWGYLSKLATRTAPPGTVAFWAMVGSMLPVAAYALAVELKTGLKPPALAMPAGLLAGIATMAFYLALHRGPASVVMPLTGMYILIPALLGIFLLREPVTFARVAGLVCAGLAVFFLSR